MVVVGGTLSTPYPVFKRCSLKQVRHTRCRSRPMPLIGILSGVHDAQKTSPLSHQHRERSVHGPWPVWGWEGGRAVYHLRQ